MRAKRGLLGRALLACALLIRCGDTPAATAQAEPLDAKAILARVKATIRANPRPDFVVYTLVRRETLDTVPDFANSYVLRIWCRTADGAALARRMSGSRARGPAQYITPAFDKPIDPGPPTADLLDVIRQAQRVAATPAPVLQPATPVLIGSVAVFIERNYRVAAAGRAGSDYHLQLDALRDPDRNRLTDLYIDRISYQVHRAVAHDHLYTFGRTIPERFEIEFGTQNGIPIITAIRGETDYTVNGGSERGEPFHAVEYRFEDVAFPVELPAWFFEPGQYGEHRDELPT